MREEPDIRDIILQRYVLVILRELTIPRRYNELQKRIKTKRTLSTKLTKLEKYGLISIKPVKVGNRYVSSYSLTERGNKVIRLLEKMT